MEIAKEITNVDDAFDLYRLLINDPQLCTSNQKILSVLSYQIDALALAKIINFFNDYPDFSENRNFWKSNLFVIRAFATFSYEIIKYLRQESLIDIDTFEVPNSLDDISSLRNKIHQFRYSNFKQKIGNIDHSMGRSRDILQPHLDICLEYLNTGAGWIFFGTNIYQFHFTEAKDQAAVNLMQEIIRVVEKETPYLSGSFKLQPCVALPKYRWEPYCYTDIVKNAQIKNKKVIDRILLAFDDLCCLLEFFKYTISVNKYLIEAPHLIYFFIKLIAITLDETFDNFNQYIYHASSDDVDAILLRAILEDTSDGYLQHCAILRNNLHYEVQMSYPLGDSQTLYHELKHSLSIVELLYSRILKTLNISPSKLRFFAYRFLRWVQSPNR